MLATLATLALAAVPVGDQPPPGWHRIYSDGFDAPSATFPTAGWTAYPPSYHDTSGHGTYDCATACTVTGGQLRLHLHGATVAAPAPVLPTMTEGRYTVRFRVPAATPGVYKIAWLLWPDRKQGGVTAQDGELDFPETNTLPGPVAAHTHWKDPSGNGDQESFPAGVDTTDWHTVTIERTASAVTYIRDGRVIGVSTGPRLPSDPMHWVLQSETRLEATGAPAAAAFADIEIDWVTVDAPGSPLTPAPAPPVEPPSPAPPTPAPAPAPVVPAVTPPPVTPGGVICG